MACYVVMKMIFQCFGAFTFLCKDHLLNEASVYPPLEMVNTALRFSGAPSGTAEQFFIALSTFQPERLFTLLIFCGLLAPMGRAVPQEQGSVYVLFTDGSQALEQVSSTQHLLLNEWVCVH